MSLLEVFDHDGYLSKVFERYEPRKGQIELAVAIECGIEQRRHVLAEGPTGTGKGISYLVPSLEHIREHPEHRVMVCTETISLQEQLMNSDLPLLQEALPYDFSYTLLKGRVNYLCRKRYNDPKPWTVEPPMVAAVEEWARDTTTGDRSELPFKPRGDLWEGYSSSSDDCIGKRCSYYKECFANKARRRAANSQVVVTNFHMLMANIQYEGAVLPPFQILVCDEAHQMAKTARDCLGYRVSRFSIRRIARWLDKKTEKSGHHLDQLGRALFDRVADYAKSERYIGQLREPGFVDIDDVVGALEGAQAIAAHRAKHAGLSDKEQGESENMVVRCEKIILKLRSCVEQNDDRNVYWLEEQKKGWFSMEARPIEVGGILRKCLFDEVPTAVLTSATMTTGGTFDFVRRELGIPQGIIEVVGESPFDWMSQSRFIVPAGIPDPPTGYFATLQEKKIREQEWGIAVADRLEDVIHAAQGRTLALFTSRRAMDFVAHRLHNLPGPLLVQEPGVNRSRLVQLFKEDLSSTLLGVASFWTGLDVPGDALSVVFIDRIPFPVPSDPVTAAINARYDAKYGAWSGFNMYSIPMAIMQMRQGVGRLIRSQRDRGVVVLADTRLLSKSYRQQFFNSLPPMMALDEVEEIREWLS